MCQAVTYQRLKTIENSKTVSQKTGHGRLRKVVVYERFQYKALTEKIFGVLGMWSLMGGSRLWEMIARGGSTVFCIFTKSGLQWKSSKKRQGKPMFNPTWIFDFFPSIRRLVETYIIWLLSNHASIITKWLPR